jgi:hypothetical protein
MISVQIKEIPSINLQLSGEHGEHGTTSVLREDGPGRPKLVTRA